MYCRVYLTEKIKPGSTIYIKSLIKFVSNLFSQVNLSTKQKRHYYEGEIFTKTLAVLIVLLL